MCERGLVVTFSDSDNIFNNLKIQRANTLTFNNFFLRYMVDPSLGDNIGEGLGREGASPYKAILGRVAPGW